jgi:translation initiation factor 1
MGNKSKKIKGGGLVFSTDKETMQGLFDGLILKESATDVSSDDKVKNTYDDIVRVWIDRKKRGGKEVTIVQGIERSDVALKELASELKAKCGVGGSAKDGEILIQGNQRDKVVDHLIKLGFRNVKKAGG